MGTEAQAPQPGIVAVLRHAARNRDLLRLQLGNVAWGTGEGAYVVGLLVVAYSLGGTGALAVLGVIRALPSVIAAPALSSAIDDFPLDNQLRAVFATRAAIVALATLVLATGLPFALLAGLAGIDAIVSTMIRPVRGAIMPALARTPEELVAANVAITTGDAAAALVGPALAAVILVIGDPVHSLATGLGLLAVATIVVWGLHVAPAARPSTPATAEPASAGPGPLAAVADLVRGFGELSRHPHGRVIAAMFFCQRFVRGMLAVLAVLVAIDLLGLGEPGTGWLNSAIGLGGLLGGVLALRLVRSRRLAPAFAAGMAAWGVGFLVPGVVPIPLLAIATLAMAGAGKVVFDVAGFTLLQRTVPTELRGRILGAIEGIIAAALACGSVAAAWLVEAIHADGALIVAGALPLLAVGLAWMALRSADDAGVIPDRALAALGAVPFFGPLGLNAMERLAGAMQWQRVEPGAVVIREGEIGDRFYIVESGRVEVSHATQGLRRLGPGDSFGEIGLLRAVRRTATVTAIEATTLGTIEGSAFLAAITGTPGSAAAAASEVEDLLASERQAAAECRIAERLMASGS